MQQSPRERNGSLFTKQELLVSFVQGIIIAAGALILYYYFMKSGASLEETRTIVFTTLLLSNIFLTFTNRSFTKTFFSTIRYKNNLALPVLIVSVCFLLFIHFIPFFRVFFGLTIMSVTQFMVCALTAFVSVIWFEFYKAHLTNFFPRLYTDHKHAF